MKRGREGAGLEPPRDSRGGVLPARGCSQNRGRSAAAGRRTEGGVCDAGESFRAARRRCGFAAGSGTTALLTGLVLSVVLWAPQSAARDSGVRVTPDGQQVLINKDVGAERWAIARNVVDDTVTGNVYRENEEPVFVWCEEVRRRGDEVTLDCFGARSCAGAPCVPEAWDLSGRVDVPVDFFEPPVPEPSTCGEGALCPEGEYCDFPDDACAGAGVCAPRPRVCTREFSPVCGCNGETYTNRCEAARVGANVAHEGECLDELAICGGLADLACRPDQYCERPLGQCLIPEALGECVPRPVPPCACPYVLAPVCGCDGRSYDNACLAACAGQAVATVGLCA